jgi:uncharacterized protein YjbI with pentapeptide repeats
MLHSKSVGNKIAEARKKLNLSQAALAQQVSISPQAIGKWERGESIPDITTLNRIAEIFGVDLNYFSDSFPSKEIKIVPEESAEENKGFFINLKTNLGLSWNLSGENYVDSDFSGITNIKDKLNGSSFRKCKLIESDLAGISFKGNSIKECDFLKSNLRNSKFYGSELKDNSFQQSLFIDAVIEASEIRNCNFTGANLSGIESSTSEFRNNNFENVIWKHVSFKNTQFSEIVFSGVLEDMSFTQCAFYKTIFEHATIKNSFFKYSDLKRVSFIDCQVDKLTYEFLKNCKANLTGINIIK